MKQLEIILLVMANTKAALFNLERAHDLIVDLDKPGLEFLIDCSHDNLSDALVALEIKPTD